MKAAGAGGIVLIGFGVLLLNLAYSGRGAAVWTALRGGSSPSTPGTTDPASGENAPTVVSRTDNGNGSETVTWSDGKTTTTPITPKGGEGAINPADWSAVKVS